MFEKEDIDKALETLRKGGIILYPTDTIWGLGCDATNSDAVKRIYEIKNRIDSKSMLALVDGIPMLERYVEEVPEIAYQLINVAINPLTIIYDNAIGLAGNLTAKDGSIGLRITQEDFSNRLCRMFRKPIVSTSANISGEKSPKNFAEINDKIKNAVDYIVKYRQDDTTESKPSNIIKVKTDGEFTIIR